MIKKSFKDLDKKMLSMMTLQERFKYINKKKEDEFNKKNSK
jgi:hypothetical protein